MSKTLYCIVNIETEKVEISSYKLDDIYHYVGLRTIEQSGSYDIDDYLYLEVELPPDQTNFEYNSEFDRELVTNFDPTCIVDKVMDEY